MRLAPLFASMLLLGCTVDSAGLAGEFNDPVADASLGESSVVIDSSGDDTGPPATDSGGTPLDTGSGVVDTGSGVVDTGSGVVDTGAVTDTGAADSSAIADSGSSSDTGSVGDSVGVDFGFDTSGYDVGGFDTAGGSCYSVPCSKSSDCPTGCTRCASYGRCNP